MQTENNSSIPLLTVDIQCVLDLTETDQEEPPSSQLLSKWAQTAYESVRDKKSEVTIRIVNQPEMMALNAEYRGKSKPTNVLSFPVEMDSDFANEIDLTLIGDIVICQPVLQKEAREQNKTLEHHYAHMVTHGVLHLCGYDHQDEKSAEEMELLEIEILAKHSITSPYQY